MARIPFAERLWCSVAEVCQVIGEGRTGVSEKIASGEILSRKAGTRRLIYVPSLLKQYSESAFNIVEKEALPEKIGRVPPATPARESARPLPEGERKTRPRPPRRSTHPLQRGETIRTLAGQRTRERANDYPEHG